MKAEFIGAMAAVFLAAGPAVGQTHAHWPADWNNWNDPALWVTVGNAGNTADTPDTRHGTYGAVAYEYNIGKYEVTAGQYAAFLNAVAKTDTYGLYNSTMADTSYGSGIAQTSGTGGYVYTVDSAFINRPVNFVSWGDAARFTNWLTNGQGNGSTETGAYNLNGAMTYAELWAMVVPTATERATWSTGTKTYFLLPSEDEWYKAAYYDPAKTGGASYWDYPTSSNTDPGQDMTEVTNSGNNANHYTSPYTYPIDSGKYTTLVGEFDNSDSPYGTFDQGGNVWEWNEAIPYWSFRGLRGGSFDDGYDFLHASDRYMAWPSDESRSFGFRVSVVPEPATLALLALGGLAFIRRRR